MYLGGCAPVRRAQLVHLDEEGVAGELLGGGGGGVGLEGGWNLHLDYSWRWRGERGREKGEVRGSVGEEVTRRIRRREEGEGGGGGVGKKSQGGGSVGGRRIKDEVLARQK